MALNFGQLGRADLALTTYTSVYTCPAATRATVNLTLVNRTATTVLIRVALTDSGTPPANEDFRVYDAELPGDGNPYCLTGIAMGPGNILIAYTDTASAVSAVADGFEAATT